MSPGARRFAPPVGLTLGALLLVALFVRLGLWQWHRGEQRQAAAARFARGTDQLVELGTRPAEEIPLYQRVSVAGELDGAHQFLLDNRTYNGHAGYEVLTPLERVDAPVLLVDRGWVPFPGTRAQLPDVSLAAGGPVQLTGRIATLPAPGLVLGRAAPSPGSSWPKVTSYPDAAQLAAALGARIEPRILLLDPANPLGYERAWQPPGLPPLRHFAYALQWWTFALLTVALWVLLSRRAPSASPA
jgi:surfeit locus 1 family protein